MKENEFLVSIIILNYNAGKLVEDCIESICKTSYKNFEVILVDNASKDNSHILCKKKFPFISLIENKENLGYCEGNNVGIKQAKGQYIVILNPDTIVESNWLNELLKASCQLGDGLYQPKILAADDHTRINTAGNMIQIFGFGYSRGKGDIDNGQYNNQQLVGYSSGACLFTSKNVLEKIGLFDPFLFAYHDDLDLGWRAAQSGIKSYYIPTSIVYHAESFSFKWSPKKFYLLERNRWYCLLTHYSKRTFYRILPVIILVEVLVFFFYVSKGMIKEKFLGYANIIKNRKLIKERYSELESRKKISDKELIQNFMYEIETPSQVASTYYSKIFNKALYTLSKMSRWLI